RGMPKEVVAKLNGAMVAALADEKVKARIADLGLEIAPREQQTPEGLAAFHKAEIDKWWPVIRAANIKVEGSRLSEVSPGVQAVAVLGPALADVVAVVHVGNHDVAHAVVGLPLRLRHGRPGAADDEHHAGGAGDAPLVVDLLHFLDVNSVAARR